jgi:hypothetical protein
VLIPQPHAAACRSGLPQRPPTQRPPTQRPAATPNVHATQTAQAQATGTAAAQTAQAQATGTPTATPTPTRITIFLGGSIAGFPLVAGPLPACQSPIWVDGSDTNLPPPDSVIRYRAVVKDQQTNVITDGGKMGQVNDAFAYIAQNNIQNPEILLIGYSAGADAALMFADEFVQNSANGRIVAVVMLGGTLSGYSEFRMAGIRNTAEGSDQSTAANLYDEVVISALTGGIPILAFDDDSGQFGDLWTAIQNLQPPPTNIALLSYTQSTNNHFGDLEGVEECIRGEGTPPPAPDSNPGSGTNVNATVRSAVITWLQERNINPADY